jgi:hypothetical protein
MDKPKSARLRRTDGAGLPIASRLPISAELLPRLPEGLVICSEKSFSFSEQKLKPLCVLCASVVKPAFFLNFFVSFVHFVVKIGWEAR